MVVGDGKFFSDSRLISPSMDEFLRISGGYGRIAGQKKADCRAELIDLGDEFDESDIFTRPRSDMVFSGDEVLTLRGGLAIPNSSCLDASSGSKAGECCARDSRFMVCEEEEPIAEAPMEKGLLLLDGVLIPEAIFLRRLAAP